MDVISYISYVGRIFDISNVECNNKAQSYRKHNSNYRIQSRYKEYI